MTDKHPEPQGKRKYPASFHERLEQFVALSHLNDHDRRVAEEALRGARDEPYELWFERLDQPETRTPQMLAALARAARRIEDTRPVDALRILNVACSLGRRVPADAFACAESRFEVWLRRGAVLTIVGRYSHAMAAFRRAVKHHHPDPNTHDDALLSLELGRFYYAIGKRGFAATKALHAASVLADHGDDENNLRAVLLYDRATGKRWTKKRRR